VLCVHDNYMLCLSQHL